MKNRSLKTTKHKPKKTRPIAAVHIGASERTLSVAAQTIITVMKVERSDAVIIEGLRTLHTICNVNGASISHCNFSLAA